MKILLLNPPGHFARAGSRWPHKNEGGLGYVPFPFWLAYAAALLEREGFTIDLKDCVALEWDALRLKEHVEQFKPNFLVMETSAPSYKFDIEALKTINSGGISTAAVGYHATALPELHLNDGFQYAIIGEYELSLLHLARYLEGSEAALPERGVATKDNPRVPHSSLFEDLDTLPLPARHLLPMERYVDVFVFGRSIQVITSRGCPFRCIFCCEAILPGKPGVRLRSHENVCNEIEHLIAQYNPDEIYFDDSSFTVNKQHVIDICRAMRERGLNIQWSCMADAKVDVDILEEMACGGCRAIKFGVECADQEVLSGIPKHVNLNDVRRTVEACRKLGIKTHATYMFGLPGETKEKAKKTIDFALSLGTDTAQFSLATPYPGTRFYEMAKEKGWLLDKGWEDFGSSVVIGYPDYSPEEIMEMHRLALAKWQRHIVFRKPGTVWHYIHTAYKRNGVRGVTNTVIEGACQLMKGLKWL